MSYFTNRNVVVTGGCGFIGSHLVDRLMDLDVSSITIIDDLSAGTTTEYLDKYLNSGRVKFFQQDICEFDKLQSILDGNDLVIHLAAQPSVPLSVQFPMQDFKTNIIGSMNLLETARELNIKEFVFAASGGTVYGEAESVPTNEREPLYPISNYGAAKAAFEMYLRSYASLYDMKCTSLRFGNVYGRRSTHGVMYDFFMKLKKNPSKLTILGDGHQSKSYLHIDDCVDGFIIATERSSFGFKAFNMASSPPVKVTQIAKFVSNKLQYNPEFTFTGGTRGWKGDVPLGELDCTKLKSLGWQQKISFEEGLASYMQWLLKTLS
ncbi:MAG: NAD-dependent epimerase/dehydratase family protein [Candidatus Kariarchaeaceae archaeon]|jgi:UDP-glucose 4-epimerase